MQKATECEGTETVPEQLVMADFESLLRVVFFYLRVRVSFPTSARWWHFLAKKKMACNAISILGYTSWRVWTPC